MIKQTKETKKMTLRFYECEHGGDLARYEEDLTSSGASILSSGFDADEEEGWTRIETDDLAAFRASFIKTEAFAYSNLAEIWSASPYPRFA